MRRIVVGLVCALGASAAALAAPTAPHRPHRNGWIVFWTQSPYPSIYALGPTASRPRAILRNRQNAKRPRLSPNRQWIAFDGASPGKPPLTDFDIQVVRRDGTDLRTVTSSTDWDVDAQWSPDGRWLSFTRKDRTSDLCGGSSIWIVHPDGTGARRVVAGCTARWSPDGTKLLYATPDADLALVPLDGGAPQRLRTTPLPDFPAGWSPDGRKILYIRARDHIGRIADVMVMDADGTHVRRLGDGTAAVWSPSGRRILYTTSLVSWLYVMDADGSHKHRIRRVFGAEPDWR